MPNMSDIEGTPIEDPPAPDTEMADTSASAAAAATSAELPFDGEEAEAEPAVPARTTFMSHLRSPVVTLLVGDGGAHSALTAHQALLVKSPYFMEACAAFADDGSPRQISLVDEDIDAVGSFLEYLYTGDYFPKKIPGQRVLETDPSLPAVDDDGEQLLCHARVYTLATRLGLPELRTLAQSKIHCVNSTARGEVAYARYLYGHTTEEDKGVRAPVAQFWATRSHVLRSEAEEEFKGLCLEFPQFGYDVLTRVLDEKVKRDSREKMQPQAGSGRKRQRQSLV